MNSMTDDYQRNLGRLVQNLQALEFVLRAFLVNLSGPGPNYGVDFNAWQVGESVPEDAFTNYDSLGVLIDKFNEAVRQHDDSFVLARRHVVDLRDALAHGRVSSSDPSLSPMRLLKFSPPRQGAVEVTYASDVDGAWFLEEALKVEGLVRKVVRANKRWAT